MSNSADKMTTIRVIPFKGTKDEWHIWEENFLARSRGKGYKGILKGTDTVPKASETIDVSDALGKASQKARDGNDDVYEDLILSINGETKEGRVAFGIVKGCKTKDLPDGDACLAWKRLCNKYLSKSTSSLLKLTKKFNNSKLRDYEDPDDWITDLEDIQTKVYNIES